MSPFVVQREDDEWPLISVEVCSTEEHLLFEVAYVRGLSRSRKESGSPTTPQLPGPGLERKTEPFFGARNTQEEPSCWRGETKN